LLKKLINKYLKNFLVILKMNMIIILLIQLKMKMKLIQTFIHWNF